MALLLHQQAQLPPPPPPPPETRCLSLETHLVPMKYALIQPLFDDRKILAVVYLHHSIIIEAQIDSFIMPVKSGFYNAEYIHRVVVDELRNLQQSIEITEAGVLFKPPSEKVLRSIETATTTSLEMAIDYHDKMRNRLSALGLKKENAFASATLQATLLHGQEVEVWTRDDVSKKEVLSRGRLSFDGFGMYSVTEQGKEMFFSHKIEDIISGDFGIEKYIIRESKDAEWESA